MCRLFSRRAAKRRPSGQREDDSAARLAERYLVPGERVVVIARRHWTMVAEPVLTALLGLALMVWAASLLTPTSPRVFDLLWWVWFALVARTAWRIWGWRRDIVVVTDKRLLLIHGIVVRKADMMPLRKVTDFSYQRTLGGRLLRYGTFVLESAGQDQALRCLERIARPNQTYQALTAEVFTPTGSVPVTVVYDKQNDAEHGAEEDDERRSLVRMQQMWNRLTGNRRGRREQLLPLDPYVRVSAGAPATHVVQPHTHPLPQAPHDLMITDQRGNPLHDGRLIYRSDPD